VLGSAVAPLVGIARPGSAMMAVAVPTCSLAAIAALRLADT
jgi:hypothetical protein